MKLDERLGEDGLAIGDIQESTEFTINVQSQPVIIDSLINLYSDPIGSIVREITSNCVDAHKEKDLKVIGKRALDTDDNLEHFSKRNTVEIEYVDRNEITGTTSAFIFRDHGVGLSEARIKEIFTVFGSSTKRGDNEEIGGFGLGSKSPFAYTDTFFVRTVRNEQEFTYMLSRGATLPTMDRINIRPLKKPNLTEVVVPIKERGHARDFVSAINRQLTYFPELVYINVNSVGHVSSASIVYETPDFVLDKNSNQAGILIGGVEYPIDSSLLGTRIPNCGVKYKFDVGELDLVPSRESIRYTDDTKAKILKKIEKVDIFAKAKIIEEVEKETNFLKKLEKTLKVNDSYSRYGGDLGSFDMLLQLSGHRVKIPFVFKDLTVSEHRLSYTWIFTCFQTTHLRYMSRMIKRDIINYPTALGNTNSAIYLKNDADIHTRKKDLHIFKVLFPGTTSGIYAIKEIPFDTTSYAKRNSADDVLIKEVQEEQKLIVRYIKKYLVTGNYADLGEFSENTGKSDASATRKANNSVFFREYEGRRHWSSYGNRGKSDWLNKEDKILSLDTTTLIYGIEEDKDALELVKPMFPKHRTIRIAKTAKNLFVNARDVKDVLVATNPEITSIVNKAYLRSELSSINFLNNFKDIDLEVYKAYIALTRIDDANTAELIHSDRISAVLKHLAISEDSLLDKAIVKQVEALNKYIKGVKLLSYINGYHSDYTYTSEFKKILKEYIAYTGQKLTV